MSTACRSCRRPAPTEKSSRVIYLARPHDIFDLFTDELEAVDCPLCGSAGSVTPNLLALSLTAHELIHLDRGAGSAPVDAIQRNFASVQDLIAQEAFAVQSVDSYEAFKAAVAARVKATANLYPNFELLTPDNFGSQWRHCEGEVFAAVAAASAKAVPGVRAGFTDPESGEQLEFSDIVEMLEYRTTGTIRLLAFSLTHFHQAAVRVEEYLLRLVETSPFLRKVADDVLQIVSLARDAIKTADPKETDAILWFQIYALEASLFLFLNKEYPREAEWAEAFLKLHTVSYNQLGHAGVPSHLRLADQRVRSTIGLPAAFNATAKFLTSILQYGVENADQDFVEKWTKALELACARFGRPGLYGQVLTRGVAVKTPDGESERDPSPQVLAEEIAELSERSGNEVAVAMIPIRLRACDWGRDLNSLDAFTEHLCTAFQESPLAKARLLTWYGQLMKDLNKPAHALMRIGRAAASWELELPSAELSDLWTERASLLRLVGAPDESLGIAMKVLNIAVSSLDERVENQAADLSVAWLNLGIYLRETGHLDEALAALSTAVKVSPENFKFHPLESLGWTLLATGRSEQALECLRYARHILKSPDAGTEYYAVLIGEVVALLVTGERAQAEALLSHGLELAKIPARSLPQLGSVFSALASRNPSDPDKYLEADKLLSRFETERQIALRDGNTLFAGAL
jgi:tetratricopeptide (TPR) repeat protein